MNKISFFIALYAMICGGINISVAKDTDSDVKPHYEIHQKDFWKYLHTDSLPDINKGKVKVYTEIKAYTPEDFQNETGAVATYNFNKSGLMTLGNYYCSKDKKGVDFKIELNDYRRPAKINWISKYNFNGVDAPEHTVETAYIPFYDRAGRIQLMREETNKIDGMKVGHINKYVVKPGPTGAPVSLICLEDQSLFVNFKPNRELQDCQIYTFTTDIPAQSWIPYNVTESQAREMVDHDLDHNIPEDAAVEYDAKGNWNKKTWKDANGETIGIIRHITYF